MTDLESRVGEDKLNLDNIACYGMLHYWLMQHPESAKPSLWSSPEAIDKVMQNTIKGYDEGGFMFYSDFAFIQLGKGEWYIMDGDFSTDCYVPGTELHKQYGFNGNIRKITPQAIAWQVGRYGEVENPHFHIMDTGTHRILFQLFENVTPGSELYDRVESALKQRIREHRENLVNSKEWEASARRNVTYDVKRKKQIELTESEIAQKIAECKEAELAGSPTYGIDRFFQPEYKARLIAAQNRVATA